MKAVLFLETTCQSPILQVAIKLTKNILILLQIIGPIILIGSLNLYVNILKSLFTKSPFLLHHL